jgi:type I restriction enzyme M protein
MARMNAFIHDMDAEIALGDTMHSPKFTDGAGRLRSFDLVTANPMWNQDFPPSTYENDVYDRFGYGIPPSSSADLGWVQHMVAELGSAGRMAVILDTGSVSRGSGNQGSNRERDIRCALIEADLIEAIILLPENLFYNTTAPGIVLVLNRQKRHSGEVLLINGSGLFTKGRPKNFMSDEQVARIADLYSDWSSTHALTAVVPREAIVANDYNLSPSRYVAGAAADDVPSLEEAVLLLREVEEDRAEADVALHRVLSDLGLWSQ